jgi:hypothetical protein
VTTGTTASRPMTEGMTTSTRPMTWTTSVS